MLLQSFKALINKFIKAPLEGILYRSRAKNDNDANYQSGSWKRQRKKVVFFVVLLVLISSMGSLLKNDYLVSASYFLGMETPTGAKGLSSVTAGVDRGDLANAQRMGVPTAAAVDCDRLMKNLRTRGSLTIDERSDFEAECLSKLPAALAKVIQKLISGEIAAGAVPTILENLNDGNASDILKALNTTSVANLLAEDASGDVAASLASLGRLSDQEREQAAAMIRATPPESRKEMLQSVKAVAELSSPNARSAMWRMLAKAKSAEELREVASFANVISKAAPDEQEVFAVAFETAPDAATRRKLSYAASEIIQIDPSDPVRGKLVKTIKQISELPPEKQLNAYEKIGGLANAYRTETDPDKKAAMANAIMSAKSLDDMLALADRIDDLNEAGLAGPINKDTAMAVIEGEAVDETTLVADVASLVKSGNMVAARKALAGEMSDDERKRSVRESAAVSVGGGVKAPVTFVDYESKTSERRTVADSIREIEARISYLLQSGVSPSDNELIELYARLREAKSRLSSIDAEIARIKSELNRRVRDLKTSSERAYKDLGIALPEIGDLDFRDELGNQPPARLSNVAETEEFWDVEASRRERRKFGRIKDQAGNSLLDQVTAGRRDVWYVDTKGNGAQGAVAANSDFTMNRLLRVPGIMRRIPSDGIATKQSSSTIILFEFLAPVLNRKTKRVQIPAGSTAICKTKSFEEDTGRLYAQCSAVDVGGHEDLTVNLQLCDANGADGLLGVIRDETGWRYAGIFLTAFTSAVLDGFSQTVVAPYQESASRSARDYLAAGAGTGGGRVLETLGEGMINDLMTRNKFWVGYDGMLGCVRQGE